MNIERQKTKEEKIKIDDYNINLKKTFKMPDNKEKTFLIRTWVPLVHTFGITKENQVIIIKQFRPWPEQHLFELPWWMLNEWENILNWAKREFEEETWYIWDFEKIWYRHTWPYSDRKQYLFIAKNCVKIWKQNLDYDEFINIELYSIEEFKKLLHKSNFLNIWLAYRWLDYIGQ